MKFNKLMQLIKENARAEGPVSIRAEATANEVSIYINDVIDGYFGANASALIKELSAAGDKTVLMYINSPGGDVFEARAMAAAIAAHKGPIEAVITGVCASAATYLALAASKVRMVEGGLFMVHESWTLAYGNKGEFRQTADLLEKIDSTIAASYAQKTNASPEQIDAWMKAETWFTAQEALDAGFIDAIDSNTQNKTSNHWNLSAYANAPKQPEQKPEEPDLTAQVAQQLQLNRNRLRLLDQA